jgi:hypothetical protein
LQVPEEILTSGSAFFGADDEHVSARELEVEALDRPDDARLRVNRKLVLRRLKK